MASRLSGKGLNRIDVDAIINALPSDGTTLSPAKREVLERGLLLLPTIIALTGKWDGKRAQREIREQLERALSLAKQLLLLVDSGVGTLVSSLDASRREAGFPKIDFDPEFEVIARHATGAITGAFPAIDGKSTNDHAHLRQSLSWFIGAAERALDHQNQQNGPKKDPRLALALALAELYEQVFSRVAATTRDGHWIAFLAAVLNKVQLRSIDIDGAYTLWLKAREHRRSASREKAK